MIDEPTHVSQPPGSRDWVGCLDGKTALAIPGILCLQLGVVLGIDGVPFIGPVLAHVSALLDRLVSDNASALRRAQVNDSQLGCDS